MSELLFKADSPADHKITYDGSESLVRNYAKRDISADKLDADSITIIGFIICT